MASRLTKIERFVQAIAEPSHPGLHNPWRDLCITDIRQDAHLIRRERLAQHLNVDTPRLLLIGEAPGYKGCRYSGVAFTSERLLQDRAVPRMEGLDGERITDRKLPWSEPSATIVWNALYDYEIAPYTVMFNAVPWHPEGARGMHSNRTPTSSERRDGRTFLEMFLAIFPAVPVAALGNTASTTLTEMQVPHTKLRHPANGGAPLFREGLKAMIDKGI